MSHVTRWEYQEAYRLLRLCGPKRGDDPSVASAKAHALGGLIEFSFKHGGSNAILSYNARQSGQWRLMRLANRLKWAAFNKTVSARINAPEGA